MKLRIEKTPISRWGVPFGNHGRFRPIATLLVLTLAVGTYTQDMPQTSIADLQKEAAAWQQKIKDVEGRITRTDAEIAGEVNAFRSYLRIEAAHKAQFQALNDSLEHDIAAARMRVDSLDRFADDTRLGGAEADNRVEEIRLTLLNACSDLKNFYETLPPGTIRASSTALDFLKSELASKTVTVSEAIERYWQITGSLDDAESSLETYSGPSPVPDMAGQTDFVRIGCAYLAAVSGEGDAAYLWVPDNSGGAWQPVTDLPAMAALRDAVRIRDRKIIPRIVELPFNHPVKVRDAVDTVPGKQRADNE